jgi:hypothetical protein
MPAKLHFAIDTLALQLLLSARRAGSTLLPRTLISIGIGFNYTGALHNVRYCWDALTRGRQSLPVRNEASTPVPKVDLRATNVDRMI